MIYLLDTQILLWTRLWPYRLSAVQQEIIGASQDIKYFSAISLWEISLKYGLNKLDLGLNTPEEFFKSALGLGLLMAVPEPQDFASFYHLPAVLRHKDPFDRMLIWQAVRHNFTLLSHDKKMPEYNVHGLKTA